MKKNNKEHIYEQIAQVYLDKKKKTKEKNFLFKTLIGLGVFFGFLILVFLTPQLKSTQINLASVSESLIFDKDTIIRLNFDFNKFNNETYALDFENLDLTKYSAINFYVRKARLVGVVNLKVEIEDANKNKSSFLVQKIQNSWQECRILLKDFKEIKNWRKITKVSFSVEDWFTQEKHDVVYIDRVKFLKIKERMS